ncbi:MAG: family 10 glycosylhydrolase [Terriglobales bacterium]
MKRKSCLAMFFLMLFAVMLAAAPDSPEQNWTNFVRIAAYGLQSHNADQIVNNAQDSNVFGIEVDNDIPGRYESFLHPEEKLAAIRAVAERAHKAGNHAFVYIAGLECITANAPQSPHSVVKDHPEWLQRKITGEPAVFGGGDAFWIAKGDEDVWISPYAPEWRKTYMERVRQIAATGIDGIYVDIPYWMTHFDGWEDTWASFDDATVAAFRKQTGLDARHDLKLGDFSDPNFRRWVDFRIQSLTDFMREIDQTAKAVNPQIKTIPEIYPGIEEEAVRVGADVYSLYAVNDAVAHEYEFGGGDHMAASRTPFDWFRYQIGMQTFRAFAEGKATWILNYSWDGDPKVRPPEPMKNLFMSEVMAGANVWDAKTHVMSGSNDMATRRQVFAWIAAHEKTFYRPRTAMDPVGVYFSPATRNYFTKEFLSSYQGTLLLLIQSHREYQIVTPRTLGSFRGKTLILPEVRVLSKEEAAALRKYAGNIGKIVAIGSLSEELAEQATVIHIADSPGARYMALAESHFEDCSPDTEKLFLDGLGDGEIQVKASPMVAAQIASVDGSPHVFFANFMGLRGKENAVQTPEKHAEVTLPGKVRGRFLPFLGDETPITGHFENGRTHFDLPEIAKGAVAWFDPAGP